MSTWPELSITETPIYESLVATNGDPHAVPAAVQPYYGAGAPAYGGGAPMTTANVQAIADTVVRAVGALMGQSPYSAYGGWQSPPGVAVGGDGSSWFVAVVGGPQAPGYAVPAGYAYPQPYAYQMPYGYQAYGYQPSMSDYSGTYQALQPAAAPELPPGADSGVWDTSGVWETDGLDAAAPAGSTGSYATDPAQAYDPSQYAYQALPPSDPTPVVPMADPSATMVQSAPPPQGPDNPTRRKFSIGRLSVSL
jgi:hypothetical protein